MTTEQTLERLVHVILQECQRCNRITPQTYQRVDLPIIPYRADHRSATAIYACIHCHTPHAYVLFIGDPP